MFLPIVLTISEIDGMTVENAVEWATCCKWIKMIERLRKNRDETINRMQNKV